MNHDLIKSIQLLTMIVALVAAIFYIEEYISKWKEREKTQKYKLHIEIKNSKLIVHEGLVTFNKNWHILELMKKLGVKNGFIKMDKKNKITSSSNIKASMHQRIRNIIFN